MPQNWKVSGVDVGEGGVVSQVDVGEGGVVCLTALQSTAGLGLQIPLSRLFPLKII